MNTKYQLVHESIVVNEISQTVAFFKDWLNSPSSKKFAETAKSMGRSVLNWGAIVLSVTVFTALAYTLFERYRKKHGDKVAAEKLIGQLQNEKVKLNKDPKTKGKYDAKINQAINKVNSFKTLEQNKKVESVI